MCVFCEIINGNIKTNKIYEDDEILAILDLSQTTIGHTLVMPKKHYANILEIDDAQLASMMPKIKMIAKNICEKLSAGGFNLLVNTNALAGQSINHLHFHIIPRYSENDTIKIEFSENQVDLAKLAEKIKIN